MAHGIQIALRDPPLSRTCPYRGSANTARGPRMAPGADAPLLHTPNFPAKDVRPLPLTVSPQSSYRVQKTRRDEARPQCGIACPGHLPATTGSSRLRGVRDRPPGDWAGKSMRQGRSGPRRARARHGEVGTAWPLRCSAVLSTGPHHFIHKLEGGCTRVDGTTTLLTL